MSDPSADARLDFPATGRNRAAILEVLTEALPEPGEVLEIASGSGQHVAFLASKLPHLQFHPTDLEARHVASIAAWTAGLPNVAPARRLDVCAPWPAPAGGLRAVLCINLVHIAPWACTTCLVSGAARHLVPGGLLYLYGPFHVGGQATAPSNAAFDESLRSRDPAWGVRDREAVVALADAQGLVLDRVIPMPANNQSLLFRR